MENLPTHTRILKRLYDVTSRTEGVQKVTSNMASDQEGRESRRSGGGKYCVAGGPGGVSCTNGQYTEGVSIHHFPDQNKDKDLHLKWVQFVRKHRPSFKGPGPRSQVILCSAHFKDECFNIRKGIVEQIGIRRTLVKWVYPSIDVAGLVQLDPEPFTDGSRRMVSMH